MSKDATNDIRTFFKIAEKQGNYENQLVQENVPFDIIGIYGENKMGKTNKKYYFANINFSDMVTLWTFTFTNTGKICKN